MTLDLTPGEAGVWHQLKSNRRGQVRKAQRNGLTSRIGGAELVEPFFAVLATNMRDLGSPVHRRSFFRNTVESLGDDARILLVERDGRRARRRPAARPPGLPADAASRRHCGRASASAPTSCSTGTRSGSRSARATARWTWAARRPAPERGRPSASGQPLTVPLHWYGGAGSTGHRASARGLLRCRGLATTTGAGGHGVGHVVRGRFPQ